jgi:hypothetical protein
VEAIIASSGVAEDTIEPTTIYRSDPLVVTVHDVMAQTGHCPNISFFKRGSDDMAEMTWACASAK